MQRWMGLLMALVLTACQNTTQWLEAAEEPALTFKEQQVDTLAARWQDQVSQWPWANLPRVSSTTVELDRAEVFRTTGPTWHGLSLGREARLLLDDRVAQGEYVLFHVPAASRTVAANLQRQLEQNDWQLLEVMTSGHDHGPYLAYSSFWQNRLSFLPQRMFVTACALVQEEATGLAILELSTRCTDLRQKAIALGARIPGVADWNTIDMGALMTHMPDTWYSSTPYANAPSCSAPSPFTCIYQHSRERDGNTLTFRLLQDQDDTLAETLHPARVLAMSQSLAQGSLPLLLQPVALKGDVPGLQLFALTAHGQIPMHSVRSEIHFLHDQRYLVFEGTLTGPDAWDFSQMPLLSQVLQLVEGGITE